MRKHIFFVPIIFFVSTSLQAQIWNAPINVTNPYSGIGGSLSYPKLLVVNGNPAMAVYDGTRGDLLFFRATDASGTAWAAPVPVDVTGIVGQYISLQIVNGNPAISYYAAGSGDLKYVRATDANGTTWATPVTIDVTGDVGQYTSLQVVNGNPAISYYDYTNSRLKYVRATDANGTAWGVPLIVDGTNVTGQYTSLQVINGNPAIAYHYITLGDLKYVRATDANGTAWAAPVTVDNSSSVVGAYCSLQVVNGNPAISYYDNHLSNDLKYVRATDANGTAWAAPMTLDAAGSVGLYTSLQIVNGNPAITYFDDISSLRQLKYIRATDASGTTWGTPVNIDVPTYSESFSCLQIVNGNPAISFSSASTSALKYIRATDVSGTAWAAPVSFSSTGLVGQYTSLRVVNAVPAISYFSDSPYGGELMYIHATDASGATWATPVYADGSGNGKYSSLVEVNGNPAIAYYNDFTTPFKLKYRRATDAGGTAWATAVSIATAGNLETKISMQVVNGNPAIAYYDAVNGDLRYVRANDANGTAWSAPVPVDVTGNVGQAASLQIVNGNPAISYYSTNGELKYVRATDASGTAWATPVTIENNFFGVAYQAYYSLEIVNGNPAISYYNANGYLKYVRATDADGTTWGSPVFVDISGNVGQWTSMQVVNGNPAISYYDVINHDLKYVRATDVSGIAWAAPVSLDITGDVGQYNSFQIVNGNPAISYYDATNKLLKFISASSTASINTSLNITSTCIASGFSVGYSSANAIFNAGNIFTAQLSDATGSFSNPVNIGTFSNTSASGSINVIIPSNTPSGSNYLIRVISSDPVITGGASNPFIINSTNNWTGAASTEWENPANWSCGSVPDANTDVVINSGSVILNSNGTCRTLTVMPGASFTVNPGFTITIMH